MHLLRRVFAPARAARLLALLAGVVPLTLSSEARAQVLRHVPYSGTLAEPAAPTPSWDALFKVEKVQQWETMFRIRAFILCPKDPASRALNPADEKPKWPTMAVFCVPWVQESATQASDIETVSLDVSIDNTPVKYRPVWVQSPLGMQRLQGAVVTAPAGKVINFNAPVVDTSETADDQIFDVQLEFNFDSQSRKLRFDERAAAKATWPTTWPAEAAGALDDQIFRDTGVDPATTLVRELDDAALDQIAFDIAKSRRILEPHDVSPLKLAKEVAGEVCRRLRVGGIGLVVSADVKNKATAAGSGPSNGVVVMEGIADLQGAFEGIDVRDAVSIFRDRKPANEAERAVALAAVYRRLGLPARVMVGFEGEADEEKERLRIPRENPELRDPRMLEPVPNKAPDRSPEKPVSRQPAVPKQPEPPVTKVPEAPVNRQPYQPKPQEKPVARQPEQPTLKKPEAPKKPESPVTTPPAKTVERPIDRPVDKQPDPVPVSLPDRQPVPPAGDVQPRSRADTVLTLLKPPRPRFWVEFALYNSDFGLAWVPVDPGRGGDNWTFGTVDGSERIVVMASSFWPDPIRVVGTPPPPPPTTVGAIRIHQSYTVKYSVDAKGVIRRSVNSGGGKGAAPASANQAQRRISDLAAGMWGYWLEEWDCPTEFQQLAIRIKPKPVVSKEKEDATKKRRPKE